jgi:hypothetical protein
MVSQHRAAVVLVTLTQVDTAIPTAHHQNFTVSSQEHGADPPGSEGQTVTLPVLGQIPLNQLPLFITGD